MYLQFPALKRRAIFIRPASQDWFLVGALGLLEGICLVSWHGFTVADTAQKNWGL